MEEQEGTTSHSTSRFPPYLALFQKHVQQVQNHLKGFEEQDSSSPSLVGGVLWTSSEKDAFFYALSVYSRFRPDLIAACVETKNELQVLEYLNLLEGGSKRHGRDGILKNVPLAHEVSDNWVLWEEMNVEEWDANQERWETASGTDARVKNKDFHSSGDHVPKGEEDYDAASYPASIAGLTHLKRSHLSALDSLLKGRSSDEEQSNAMSRQNSSAEPFVDKPSQESEAQTSVSSGSRASLEGSSSIATRYSGDSEEPSLPRGLSPRSRRRLYKRIHMRRKRAQAKGAKADTSTDLLRKGRAKLDTSEEFTESGPGNLMRRSSENPDDINHERQLFSRHGATFDTLEYYNLDLFHLSKIGKLMSMYMTGYGASPSSEDEDYSISVDLLRLLFEITKDFLIQVIGRVTVLEEQHRRMRGTSKVWRRVKEEAGNINPVAVQYALKTMGISLENKKQYFERLLGEEVDQEDATTYKTGYDDNDRILDSSNVFHQHPLLQDLRPPHYLNTHGGPDPQDRDELMDVDADEGALEAELDEDEELDEADRLADEAEEKQLWKEVPPTNRDRRMLNQLKNGYI